MVQSKPKISHGSALSASLVIFAAVTFSTLTFVQEASGGAGTERGPALFEKDIRRGYGALLSQAQQAELGERETANYIIRLLSDNVIKGNELNGQIWGNNCNNDGSFCKTQIVYNAVFAYQRPYFYFDISYYYTMYWPEDGKDGRNGSEYTRYAVDMRYLSEIEFNGSGSSVYNHYHLNLRCDLLCVTLFHISWNNAGSVTDNYNFRDASISAVPIAILADPIVAKRLKNAILRLKALQPPPPKDPFD